MSSATLSAEYTSETNAPFKISKSIPLPSDTSVVNKQSYLNALRQSVIETQERINKELTNRMEEDNKRSNKKSSIDDAKEEDNYGEEVVSGEE
ncbi:gon7 family [Podospora fimiseda]|uniref:EKC/KEOPS complex subunit GON7 n=1 Tax=Podospora fimiseda TaxID=252190 RepID=A0AAN7BS31_9PEZI|nr:gon7 family [Podospora fimiseda]